LLGLIGAEAVVDDLVVFIDAALHLGLAAAGEHGESGCGQERGGDLVGAAHGIGETKENVIAGAVRSSLVRNPDCCRRSSLGGMGSLQGVRRE
jgi:hypothetical protein